MHQTAIDFVVSKNLSLEGIFTKPDTPHKWFPTAVVCHPHPMLGGSMEHPLVTTICRVAHREGIGSLRFNFRGVGGSEGSFSNGDQEHSDVKAALEIAKLMPGADPTRLALVGYSFGASTVLRGLRRYRGAKSLVLISPPLASVRNSPIMKDRRHKMFIVGQDDRVVRSVDLQRLLDDVRQPVRFHEIQGANHAFIGQTEEVAERVAEFLLETLEAHGMDY